MRKKEHYKMFKAGKNWLYAGIFMLSLGAGMVSSGTITYAQTTTDAASSSSTKKLSVASGTYTIKAADTTATSASATTSATPASSADATSDASAPVCHQLVLIVYHQHLPQLRPRQQLAQHLLRKAVRFQVLPTQLRALV
ncbi:KxYKxGKxW signal peptide domain-containing protein [Secundilactobacillus odoratitofui]|uniref:KxYKxGKxW signal peptide domain-containing protein n=1 Tax=Secundilactobacillus odoratitofui TaxID=480930 RepID=UPI000B091CAA|nr:KxYKxGKxW signal peptide domain-containing protein [Secundilactobacillus odoratitofui]